ncbi:HalOD1 output domain-containing protein [Haloprofundus salinisoli]|uniref:HalOD1 output domain-containing protein n=1 Tax=Haloprofundus salinisoli TaxID=2876193 RepID=UPI001CC8EED1|nr:HalOD1 output domain-containing protein [Haloprofundus salinisoli]
MDTISTQAAGVREIREHENASDAVVMAVADARNADPLELDPLYDTIDPDALDAIFSSSDSAHPSVELEFDIGGCHVTVRGTGEILVSPPPADTTTVADPIEN